jgi:hypothetical protein
MKITRTYNIRPSCFSPVVKSATIALFALGSLAFGDTATITRIIEDFETESLTGWTTQPDSNVALTNASDNIFSGTSALQWTYTRAGTNYWNNEVQRKYTVAQDWSAYDTFSFYIKAGESYNGQRIYFTAYSKDSAGKETQMWSNGFYFAINPSADGFVKVSINLPADKLRTEVTWFKFYVNGNETASPGAYTSELPYLFYIDDITLSGPAPIPEPASIALALGILALPFAAWRFAKRSHPDPI